MTSELELDVRIVRQYINGERNRVGDLWCAYIADESFARIVAALGEPIPYRITESGRKALEGGK